MHRLLQYYESKVHLKVVWSVPKTWLFFYKHFNYVVFPFITLPSTLSEQKMVNYTLQNCSLKFFKKLSFCVEFHQNGNSKRHSNVDCGVNEWMTNFCFGGVKRSVVNGAMTFFKSLFQNDCIREWWAVENQDNLVLWSTFDSKYWRYLYLLPYGSIFFPVFPLFLSFIALVIAHS